MTTLSLATVSFPKRGHPLADEHRRPLSFIESIFVLYCVLAAALASGARGQAAARPHGAAAILGFAIVNVLISRLARRAGRPQRVELLRAVLAAGLGSLAYLAAAGSFGGWWPAFLIMCLISATLLGLPIASRVPGRLLTAYYLALMFVAEALGSRRPDWRTFAMNAGVVAVVGLLVAKIVALITTAVDAERERQEQLAREVARSEALRASEERFRSLVELSPDHTAVLSPEGTYRYVSPTVTTMVGYSSEELLGRHFSTLVHSEDLQLASCVFEHALAAPSASISVEIRVQRKDGALRDWELVARRLPDGDVVGFGRDVTEHRRIETALRTVVEGTGAATGCEFLRSLVQHLAAALRVRYAFVSEVLGTPPTRVRTLALWAGRGLGENVEYDLADTPCEGVLTSGFCHYPSDLQTLFPRDSMLAELEAQSYMGVPIVGADGRTLGHLAMLDDKPMVDDDSAAAVLHIFAARAGAEWIRQKAADPKGADTT